MASLVSPHPIARRFTFPIACAAFLELAYAARSAIAQNDSGAQTPVRQNDAADVEASDQIIEVRSLARDEEIAGRLTRILNATGRYEAASVEVRDGVVFLSGRASSESDRALPASWRETPKMSPPSSITLLCRTIRSGRSSRQRVNLPLCGAKRFNRCRSS